MNPDVTGSEGQSNDSTENKVTSRDHKRTTVRFTDAEFERISDESKISGESIPKILKNDHFRHHKLKLLFDHNDALSICSELRRIGNNVNQIARAVNTGAREGWYPAIEDAARALSEMLREVSRRYGVR